MGVNCNDYRKQIGLFENSKKGSELTLKQQQALLHRLSHTPAVNMSSSKSLVMMNLCLLLANVSQGTNIAPFSAREMSDNLDRGNPLDSFLITDREFYSAAIVKNPVIHFTKHHIHCHAHDSGGLKPHREMLRKNNNFATELARIENITEHNVKKPAAKPQAFVKRHNLLPTTYNFNPNNHSATITADNDPAYNQTVSLKKNR